MVKITVTISEGFLVTFLAVTKGTTAGETVVFLVAAIGEAVVFLVAAIGETVVFLVAAIGEAVVFLFADTRETVVFLGVGTEVTREVLTPLDNRFKGSVSTAGSTAISAVTVQNHPGINVED